MVYHAFLCHANRFINIEKKERLKIILLIVHLVLGGSIHVPWNSPLVQHLLTSWWPVWQPSYSLPYNYKQVLAGSKPGPIVLLLTLWDQADALPTELCWLGFPWVSCFYIVVDTPDNSGNQKYRLWSESHPCICETSFLLTKDIRYSFNT